MWARERGRERDKNVSNVSMWRKAKYICVLCVCWLWISFRFICCKRNTNWYTRTLTYIRTQMYKFVWKNPIFTWEKERKIILTKCLMIRQHVNIGQVNQTHKKNCAHFLRFVFFYSFFSWFLSIFFVLSLYLIPRASNHLWFFVQKFFTNSWIISWSVCAFPPHCCWLEEKTFVATSKKKEKSYK